MTEYAIKVENLSKRYSLGERETYKTLRDTITETFTKPWQAFQSPNEKKVIWALHNIGFEVKHGEAVGIIGRNGAGKSTLLKILSRITEPTTGRALLYGRVGALLEVGTGFNHELTGRENIYLSGAILGMRRKEIERKFDEMVSFAEIEEFIDTPVKRYSSGMYMRLAFAVAAHLEPEILVVDEVLAVGDAAFQKKCLGKMSDVAHEGRTVLFVSHNMPAILRLCSQALLLEKGQVMQVGSASEVVEQYTEITNEGSASQTWDIETAPGNESLHVISMGALNRQYKLQQLYSINEPITVELKYIVHKPQTKFRCLIMLYTQGVCAFSTLEPKEQERDRGVYISRVTIPAHLLAEGEYSAGFSIFSSKGVKSHLARKMDVLTFQLIDPIDGTSARGDYTEGLAGVMRPKLEWQIIQDETS